ncbi:MAG TPA: transmembrane domain-containing protein, partial [Dehalococcoidia bacterium]|nr:transmembrane domain-containing protein [Dehalococcoidia bacterium]
DEQFAAVVAYIPSDWGIVRGETIPIGAIVGNLTSKATLGLVGAACNQELPVEFDMVNASIDIKDTVSFDDTDKTDRDNTRDYAKDVNPKNGLYDSFDKYPDFINRVFDTPDLQPIRRSAGMAIVASTPVLLQFLVFAPGTLISKDLPNDVSLGYPSVTLLQNAGDPDANPEPGPITDFCTPLTSHNVSFGVSKDNPKTEGVDETGYTVSVNPKDGKYTFTTAGAGQRDADGDSYENSLDTCPYDKNVGDPRITADGDLDQDGLDAACDPNDDPATGGTNSDEDGDGYLNRQDNCPLIANGEDSTNQHDEDKDQIGDECDKDKTVADGELIKQLPTKDITIGAGGTGGSPLDAPACSRDGKVVCYDLSNPVKPTSTSSNSEDSGGSSAVIFIVIGVVAALVIVGGGAFALTRRRSS